MRREFQAAVGGGVGMDGSHPTMGGGKAVFTSTWNETRGSRIIFMMSAFGGCGRGRYRWPIPIRDEKVRHMTTRKHNIDLASKLISYESKPILELRFCVTQTSLTPHLIWMLKNEPNEGARVQAP
jgi:hypothetical protein